MITEYTKHQNKEKNWELHEIRTFDKNDRMDDAFLLVLDSKTKEVIVDERLQDDVWQFEWEVVVPMEKFEDMSIADVKTLKNLDC